MAIVFRDNMISAEEASFTFESSYDIAINDCLVECVYRDNIVLNLNGTEALSTLESFFREVADAVDVEPMNYVDMLTVNYEDIIDSDIVYSYKGRRIDVVLEWKSFYVHELDGMLPDLTLKTIDGITLMEELSPQTPSPLRLTPSPSPPPYESPPASPSLFVDPSEVFTQLDTKITSELNIGIEIC